MEYYREPIDVVLNALTSSENGLSQKDAPARLERYGHNELEAKKAVSPLFLFLGQFRNFIIYILLFAVAISLLAGEYIDAIVILIILLFNAFSVSYRNFVQKNLLRRSENSLHCKQLLFAMENSVSYLHVILFLVILLFFQKAQKFLLMLESSLQAALKLKKHRLLENQIR